jgi:hypothetical protein
VIINGIKKIKNLFFGGLLYLNTGINLKPFVNKQNLNTMKKLLVVLAIGAFAACNGSGSTTSADSTKVSADSSKMSTDSSKMSTDTSKMKADTSKMKMDSTKK